MCVSNSVSHPVIDALVQIRKDWETVADGESLVDVQGSVGLLLGDVVSALGLQTICQNAVLGDKLSEELQETMSVRYSAVETG